MTGNRVTSAADLLGYARAVLNETGAIPRAQRSRAAALLARQALEDVVVELCESVGAHLRSAKMRTRLISLRVLLGSDAADLAEVTWGGLSQSCHHHAFELAPTVGEVQHLIDQVADLASRVSTARADARLDG